MMRRRPRQCHRRFVPMGSKWRAGGETNVPVGRSIVLLRLGVLPSRRAGRGPDDKKHVRLNSLDRGGAKENVRQTRGFHALEVGGIERPCVPEAIAGTRTRKL